MTTDLQSTGNLPEGEFLTTPEPQEEAATTQEELVVPGRNLGQIDQNIENIMAKGLIIDMEIGRWGGKAQFLSHDLFPEASEDFHAMFSHLIQGSKYLLPREEIVKLSMIESKVRGYLSSVSFRTFWGYFIPFRSLERFVPVFEDCKVKYMQTAREIAEQFDFLKIKVESEYKEMLSKQISDPILVNQTVDLIMKNFISPEKFIQKIKFEFSFITVSPQTVMESMPQEARKYYNANNVYDKFARETMGEFVSLVRESLLGMIEKLKGDKLKSVQTKIARLRKVGESLNIFGIDLSELNLIEEALNSEEGRRAQEAAESMYARFGKLEMN